MPMHRYNIAPGETRGWAVGSVSSPPRAKPATAPGRSGRSNSPDFALGSIQIGERKAAQRFTTRPNTAGYLLQSVVLNLHAGVGTGNAVHVAIHENSSGNPGTQLALLNNPADPIGNDTGTAGNRTFSAPSPLPLDANTQYCTPICRGRSIE